MRGGQVSLRRQHLLALAIGLLAFACGALAIAWRADHRRVTCYQEMADEGLVAGSDCRH